MAYIGRNLEQFSNVEKLDNITFTDSAGPYNLLKDTVAFIPATAQSLLIEVDGIIQTSDSYTITGSTITFGVSMASTSTMNSIVQLGVGLISTPADGTVTAAKIASDAVTTAKILDNNVTVAKLPTTLDISGNTVTLPASVSGLGTGITNAQLAGSITDAKITGLSSSKLTGALPAISGASLTALNATNIGSGTVPTARLGSGSASSSVFLAGDNTWAAPSGAGMWTKIKFQEITSGDSELEFINGTGGVVFDSTYQYYLLQFRNYVGSVADRKMALEISLDTGVSWKSSGYEGYAWQSGFVDSKRLAYTYSMIAMQEMGIVAGEGAFGYIQFDNPSQTKLPTCLYNITQGQNSQDPQGYNYVGGGTYMTSTAYDGIRITTSGGSGEITTVQATLWGAKD
jgi:hypothetical protein